VELRLLSREREATSGWLDEMFRLPRSIRLGSRIQEWQEAYSRLRHNLPSKYHLSKYHLAHATFDVVSNRVLYSREPLERFWNSTVEHIKGRKIWKIDPGKLTTNLIKDFFLIASFVFTFRAGPRAE
jgi:hypothetical protein